MLGSGKRVPYCADRTLPLPLGREGSATCESFTGKTLQESRCADVHIRQSRAQEGKKGDAHASGRSAMTPSPSGLLSLSEARARDTSARVLPVKPGLALDAHLSNGTLQFTPDRLRSMPTKSSASELWLPRSPRNGCINTPPVAQGHTHKAHKSF